MSSSIYSYYDYIENYYVDYYETYYENYYGPLCNQTYISSVTSNISKHTDCYNGTYPQYELVHPFNVHFLIPPCFSILVISNIVGIIIAALFFYRTSQAKKSRKKSPDNVTVVLTSMFMISSVFYNIVDFVTIYMYFIDYEWYTYHYTAIVDEAVWAICKCLLYSVFMYRYYNLAKASIDGRMSVCRIRVTFGGIIFVILAQMALNGVYTWAYYQYNNLDWDAGIEAERHYQSIYSNILWVIFGVDIVLISSLGYLLLSTILRLIIEIGDPEAIKTIVIKIGVRENSKSMSNSAASFQNKNIRQRDLIHVTTRIALTCLISVISSFIFFSIECFVDEMEFWELSWLTYLWCVDVTINMLCVYLSMGFAKDNYETVCQKYCMCHQCVLICIVKIIDIGTDKKYEENYKKQQQQQQIEMQAMQTNLKKSSDAAGSIIIKVGEQEDTGKDYERWMVKEWLENVVELPQYYDLFIQNGYDGMKFVKTIHHKEELKEIGIHKMGHIAVMMAEICVLRNNE